MSPSLRYKVKKYIVLLLSLHQTFTMKCCAYVAVLYLSLSKLFTEMVVVAVAIMDVVYHMEYKVKLLCTAKFLSFLS